MILLTWLLDRPMVVGYNDEDTVMVKHPVVLPWVRDYKWDVTFRTVNKWLKSPRNPND